jgi:hypothetical protein
MANKGSPYPTLQLNKPRQRLGLRVALYRFPVAKSLGPPTISQFCMAKGNSKTANGSHLGFEAVLWAGADKLALLCERAELNRCKSCAPAALLPKLLSGELRVLAAGVLNS